MKLIGTPTKPARCGSSLIRFSSAKSKCLLSENLDRLKSPGPSLHADYHRVRFALVKEQIRCRRVRLNLAVTLQKTERYQGVQKIVRGARMEAEAACEPLARFRMFRELGKQCGDMSDQDISLLWGEVEASSFGREEISGGPGPLHEPAFRVTGRSKQVMAQLVSKRAAEGPSDQCLPP